MPSAVDRSDSPPTGSRQHRGSAWLAAALVAVATGLTGCAYKAATLPVSDTHLSTGQMSPKSTADILSPVSIPTPPPPRPQPKLPTYSVVVNEVPVKELLFALARDTKQNIDVHPGLQGLVSLNAIDETLPAILDRLAQQANLRWRQEGRTISVAPDTPQVRTYRVDYVNVSRETTSTVGVSGLVGNVGTTGTSGGGGAGGGGTSGGAGANTSSTTVNTSSKNEFWKVLEDNVKSILAATRAQALSADERAARTEGLRAQREERIAQAEAVARAGQNAKDLFSSAFDAQTTAPLPGDVTNEVAVNPVAGTVTILATDRQHTLVQQYLDAVMAASQRQVLIEATIVEVELSRAYQAGIDWGRVASSNGAGVSFSQNLLGTALNAAPNLTIGYSDSPANGIFATVKLLEQFGNTRVLSSPKLMALNNQTALLKVVRNQVYFTIQSTITQGTSTGPISNNLQATTTTARTVPIGLVMAMTPQINSNGQVTITVRPTVTSQVGTVDDPNPILAAQNLRNAVPIVEVREIESVLQIVSGNVAVLGGLIKDEVVRDRDQVPGVGNTRVGDLFAYRNERSVKTELVIFLRPTVVTNPSLDSDELKFLRPLLPNPAQMGLAK
ncbi:MAG: secretin N-terminal domain-containing protein [Burkholderiales bacterium]|nr:secretin N-terminal domain-containing protein [Burkholderiales bacterium]